MTRQVRSSAHAQCTAIEATKRKHYDKYYRSFARFVITVSCAVSQASAEALMRLMRAVARGDHSIVDWEPARWMDDLPTGCRDGEDRGGNRYPRSVGAPRLTAWTMPDGPCDAMPCYPLSHAVRESRP